MCTSYILSKQIKVLIIKVNMKSNKFNSDIFIINICNSYLIIV